MELLKIHTQSYLGYEIENVIFNSNIGNSLELDIKEKWNIEGFDAIISNPPYQEKNINGKTKQGKNKLYTKFIEKDLNRLNKDGILCYVSPSWFYRKYEYL